MFTAVRTDDLGMEDADADRGHEAGCGVYPRARSARLREDTQGRLLRSAAHSPRRGGVHPRRPGDLCQVQGVLNTTSVVSLAGRLDNTFSVKL